MSAKQSGTWTAFFSRHFDVPLSVIIQPMLHSSLLSGADRLGHSSKSDSIPSPSTNQICQSHVKPKTTWIIKKFDAFYGTQRFSIVFTRAFHWYLPWVRWIWLLHCVLFYVHMHPHIHTHMHPSTRTLSCHYVWFSKWYFALEWQTKFQYCNKRKKIFL